MFCSGGSRDYSVARPSERCGYRIQRIGGSGPTAEFRPGIRSYRSATDPRTQIPLRACCPSNRKRARPDLLADLTEGGALTQQLCGQSMAKLARSVSGSVKAGAQETMPNDRSNDPTPLEPGKPRMGAKTRLLVLCGRPCRRYVAIALPTSAGNRTSLRRPLLPCTLNFTAFQSMSSSLRNVTSPERKPSRASRSKTA